MNTVSRYSALLVAGLLLAGTAHAQTSPSSKQPAQEGDAQALFNGSPNTFKEFEQGHYTTGPGTQFSGPVGTQKQRTQEGDPTANPGILTSRNMKQPTQEGDPTANPGILTSRNLKQPTQEGDAQNLFNGSPAVFNEYAKGHVK